VCQLTGGGRRQQGWAWKSGGEVANGIAGELEGRSALSSACRDDSEESFAGESSVFASGPLADFAIDHHKSDGLLRAVVGRIDLGSSDEGEVGLAVFA